MICPSSGTAFLEASKLVSFKSLWIQAGPAYQSLTSGTFDWLGNYSIAEHTGKEVNYLRVELGDWPQFISSLKSITMSFKNPVQ